MDCRILDDDDVRRYYSMKDAIDVVEEFIRDKAMGKVFTPPRFNMNVGSGAFVFSVSSAKNQKTAGFRFYSTIGNDLKIKRNRHSMTVVDYETGNIKGIILGKLFGSIRTGAIGGVAIRHMSRPNSKSVGVIGSGWEARTQLEAAVVVRNIQSVRVYSPNPEHRKKYALEMREKLGIDIADVETSDEAVTGADILICATVSKMPVFNPTTLKEGTHLNSLAWSPYLSGEQELAPEVIRMSQIIATDSLAQVDSHEKAKKFLENDQRQRIVELDDFVVARRKGRNLPGENTLFLSTGLPGTELVVANDLLKRSLN